MYQYGVDEDNPRWPQAADALFITGTGPNWHSNAAVNFLDDMQYGYIAGFIRAGEILADHIRGNNFETDVLIYPIVFIYRHHLELLLKQIITDSYLLLGSMDKAVLTHKLDTLWADCEDVLQRVGLNCERADLDNATRLIHEFAAHDPGAMAFRYKEDRVGKRSIPGLDIINISNFADVMKGLSNFLGCVLLEVRTRYNRKLEVEAAGS